MNCTHVTPNGTSTGTISVKANACSAQSTASTKSVTLNLFNPSAYPAVTGPSVICNSGNEINLSNLPGYASVNWTYSSNLTAVSGQGTSTFTIKASTTSTSGTGWVDANLTTPCDDDPVVIRKTVWVGKPYAFQVTGPTLVQPSTYHTYSAEEWNGQPSFSTQGVGSGGFSWSFDLDITPSTIGGWDCGSCAGQDVYVLSGPLSTWVSAHVENSCGKTSNNYEVFVQQENCPPGGCEEPFFVYPNPASEEIVIPPSNTKSKSALQQVIISDSNGSVVFSTRRATRNQTTIPISHLNNGIYFMTVIENGTKKQHQIVISH